MTSGYDSSDVLNMKLTLTYPTGFDATSEGPIDGLVSGRVLEEGGAWTYAQPQPIGAKRVHNGCHPSLLPAAVSKFDIWLQDAGSSLKLGPITSSTVGLWYQPAWPTQQHLGASEEPQP